MKLLLASLVGCLAWWEACAQPGADFVVGGGGLEHGVITWYSDAEFTPSFEVRLEKAYTDYEAKGFFRIGVLPMAVLEGVSFKLEHPASVADTLAQMHQWLRTAAARRLELRRVSLLVSAPVTNLLYAGRARLATAGTLELLDGVEFTLGTNHLRSACGRLQITGQKAGQVILGTTPPYTMRLFGCDETVKVTNERNLK
jgi:hypothetical protein